MPVGTAAGSAGDTQIPTSGAIRAGQFRGVTRVVSFTPGLTGGGTTYEDADGGTSSTVILVARTTGVINISGSSVGAFPNKQWGSPTTTGIGNSYWIKFTLTASTATGTGTGTAPATTAWLQLSSDRQIAVTGNKTGLNGTRIVSGTYTIQIATDAAGSNIVATATGYVLRSVTSNI